MSAKHDLSFLPDDYLENKARRRANFICGGLFLITGVMIALAVLSSQRSLRVVEQQNADVSKQFNEAARRIEQMQKMQDKERTTAHQADLTAALLEKVPRSVLLAKITNSLPAGVSLEELNLESKVRQPDKNAAPQTAFEIKKANQDKAAAPEQAKAKVYDVTLKITGLAPTDLQVAELIRNLNADGLFKDVNLIVSDWDKDERQNNQKDNKFTENFRKFQIEMTINPTADLQNDPTPIRTASLDQKETNE